ncbi:MAG: SBBP repeat-containing protein [Phormidium sp.]
MTEVIWAKGYGSTGLDSGIDIATDSSGNLYTIGYFSGSVTFGNTTLTSQGNSDVYITKQDSSGNVIWAKSVPGTVSGSAKAIVTDSSGNIYTTGIFSGSATFGSVTLTSQQGNNDIFVAKLDSSGNFTWAKNYGSLSSADQGYDITTDSSGNLYVAGLLGGSAYVTGGTLSGNDTPGSTKLTSFGGGDILVTKLDSNGNVAWAKNFGSITRDQSYSIATDSSGNVYTTGLFAGSATFGSVTLTSQGGTDIFVAKQDSNGNVAWAKNFGSTTNDNGFGIATDSSGNLYTTGNFTGNATFGSVTLTSQGDNDIFVTKLDSSGNVAWAKSFGSIGSDAGISIATDSSGNVYTTGIFAGSTTFGSVTLTSKGSNDIFVAKLDSSGNVVSAIGMGGSDTEQARSIATDNSGNAYITGGFKNTATFGTKLLTSQGNDDIYVAKLSLLPNVTLGSTTLAREQGHVNGTFSITLDTPAPQGGLTVNYSLGGNATNTTDYTLATGTNVTAVSPTSFTIAAGQTTATLNVVPVDDSEVEPTEVVQLTLTSSSSYKLGTITQAIVPILDDDVAAPIIPPIITIAAGTNPSEAGSTDGTFVLTLDKPAPAGGLSINYGVAGTATNNTDYTLAPGNNIIATTDTDFTIAAGQTTATINVSPFDDNIVDPNETIQLTLNNGTGYSVGATNNASVTITDNDVTAPIIPTLPSLPNVTIAPGTNPSERGTINGTYLITLDKPAPAGGLVINYKVAGTATRTTDYTLATGNNITSVTAKSFTIAAGQTTATLNVTPVDDAVVDPNETVQLTLERGTNYNLGAANNATLTIADDVRVVSIAPGTNATERDSNNGTFLITLDNPAPAGGLTITYKVAGTATETTDFSVTPGTNITNVRPKTFTIAAGQKTATLNVTPVDDAVFDPGETVQLTLERGTSNYTLGATSQASITIADNTPTVTITSKDFASERGLVNGTFVIILDSPTPAGGLTINYSVTGTVTLTTDYTLAIGNNIANLTATSFTIAAGQTTAILNVTPVGDTVFDPNESVQLVLNSGNGYNVGAANNASVAIADQADCFCDYVTAPDLNNLPGVLIDLYPADDFLDDDDNGNFIVGDIRNNQIFGFVGDDFVLGEGGSDNLVGGKGNDNLYGSNDDDWVAGGEGDDFLNGNEGLDYVNGNEGNDTVRGGQKFDFLRGGRDNDIIYGDKGNDVLAGDKGDDTIFGGGSNDLSGSTDDDVIFGGEGNDLLHGNTGKDFIFAENGNDTLYGGQGQDYLFGEAGDDLVFGDLGNDFLCGDDGNDTLYGGNGTDVSDSDNDEICGGIGDDLIFGNQGTDWLNGGSGKDSIYGGKGDDTLIGGDDNDLLSGDAGNDSISGGNGSDQFVLASGKGSDVITDFQDGVDFIALSGGLTFAQLAFTQSGNNTVITQLGSNELLGTLNGVAVNLITQADFISLA